MEVPKPFNAGDERETHGQNSDASQGSGLPGSPADSARGWLRIQLAVLGFVGFCSVTWAGGASSAPPWAQGIAAALVSSSFVLALVAIFLVGTVAYALPGTPEEATGAARRGPGRLRTGIVLTYLAMAAVVAATLTAWWPAAEGGGPDVEVRGADSSLCGELLDGPDGALRLNTADGVVDVPLTAIINVAPVANC